MATQEEIKEISIPTNDDEYDIESLAGGSANSNEQGSNQSPSTTDCRTTTTNSSDEVIEGDRGAWAVVWSRWFFLFVLFAAAAILGSLVYVVLRNEETEFFEEEFNVLANEFTRISNYNAAKKVGVLEALSKSSTSCLKSAERSSKLQEGSNGFLTLPDVEEHFGTAREAMYAVILGYAPRLVDGQYMPWVNYSTENQGWISEANSVGNTLPQPISEHIWQYSHEETGGAIYEIVIPRPGSTYSPIWQLSPPPPVNQTSVVNFDLGSLPNYAKGFDFISRTESATFLNIQDHSRFFDQKNIGDEAQTAVVHPVFSSFEENATIVGNLIAVVPLRVFFEGVLIEGSAPIQVVVSNTCQQVITFEVTGDSVKYLGEGDLHATNTYYHMEVSSSFGNFVDSNGLLPNSNTSEQCVYYKSVYPTKAFEDSYKTSQPLYMALAVVAVFVFTALAFLAFDSLVTKRQARILKTAKKQNAIMSSLFPKSIKKQLMAEVEDSQYGKSKLSNLGKAGLRSYLNHEDRENQATTEKPIADLFPETTIMFADISGFTAWSSAREPSQVFTLLETIYREFDRVAKRRRVFKVEVVGDCYVAVCGLPDQRHDHAVVMAKFAQDCLDNMVHTTKELEIELGPDTSELGLRVGLHSGPVVAGVLRGEKSRFQLFGDAMNTTSRMESTGIPNRIQVSQETADLLLAANKGSWITPRDTKVEVKGKGQLQTYFLAIHSNAVARSNGHSHCGASLSSGEELVSSAPTPVEVEERQNRVADWTVEVLSTLLKSMVAGRNARNVMSDPPSKITAMELAYQSHHNCDKMLIDEVAEVIVLPDYSAIENTYKKGTGDLKLEPCVMDELRNYVQTIAKIYNDNPFHNFDHANHVVMSVNKLLSRIVAPDLDDATEKNLHDHTYGITSDPLTWFSVVFAALIHDVDHSGVPNAQLVKEGTPLAILYNSKSVAEQNSIEMSWDLLMEPAYANLRRTIYATTEEFARFRQLVVNTVMATDIVDKDMKQLRNDRWEAAFETEHVSSLGQNCTVMKATIVIEHLIQASDVVHTMQHWHVYRRWNEKFFAECMKAYAEGRAENNPAETWYEGEKGFFDFYIIPLAKKLKECGVFGVSSDEYLMYAMQNRKEWEERGKDIVQEMLEKVQPNQIRRRGTK